MGYSANEDVYAPCACGSGKKYKFCCLEGHRKERRKTKPRALTHVFAGDPLEAFAGGMEAHEKGSVLLEKGRFAEAMEEFQRSVDLFPFAPQPRNNMALIHFQLGDIDRAVEICETVLRSLDTGNVFALGSLVHYYLFLGREEDARAALEDLLRSSPRDEFASHKKYEALARFQRHEDILSVALEAMRFGERKADFAFFAGTALANLARYEEARRQLSWAISSPNRGRRAKRYLELLAGREAPDTLDGCWRYLELAEWAPRELAKLLRNREDSRRYPGLADAYLALLEERPEEAGEILQVLASSDTLRSKEILWKIARGTFGPDAMRASAARELSILGEIPRGESIPLWLEGRWTDVIPSRVEITPEAASPLPEECRTAMDKVVRAIRKRDWTRAERLAREVLPLAPQCAMVYQNLAIAVHGQGRTKEAEDLLLRAIEVDPSYLFAPATLALLRAAEGRVKEAKEILRRVVMPARVHPDAQRAFLEAQARVALLGGDVHSSLEAMDLLEVVAPESKLLKPFRRKDFRGLLGGVRALRRNMEEEARSALRKLLPREPSLAECLEGVPPWGPLVTAMALDLEVDESSLASPEDLRALLLTSLTDPEIARRALDRLSGAAAAALRELSEAGGFLPFAEFCRRHKGSSDPDLENQRETPVENLGRHGLVYLGAIGAKQGVVIPCELRPLVRAWAARPRTSY